MKTIQNAAPIDYFWLMLLSGIWGSAFVGIEYALTGFHPFLIAFFRICIAALVLLLMIWLKKLTFPRDRQSWGMLLLLGFTNNAMPFYLISWGQQYVSANTAAVMLAIGPFIALIMSHIITHDEKIDTFKLIGVAMGFTGVFILFGEDFFTGEHNSLYGKLAMLIAVIGYITSGLLIRKLSHMHTLICSCSMFMTASVMMMPFLWFIPLRNISLLSYPFLTILYLAIIPTALASLVRINLVQKIGIQFMSQVSYLIPMFAIFWSWVFFDTIPELIVWIALVMILGGLFIRKLKV